jgi:hypothetical protein
MVADAHDAADVRLTADVFIDFARAICDVDGVITWELTPSTTTRNPPPRLGTPSPITAIYTC